MATFQTKLNQTIELVEKRVRAHRSEDPMKDLTFLSDHYSSKREWDKATAATRHMLALAEGDNTSKFEFTPIDVGLHQSQERSINKSAARLRKVLPALFFTAFVLGAIFVVCAENPKGILDLRTQIFSFDAQGFEERARYFYNLNKLKEAITDCNRALSISPNCSPALQLKASILVDMGDLKAAWQANEQSNGKNARYWYNRSHISRALGHYEDAAESLEKADRIDPDPNNKMWIAFDYGRIGKYDEGLRFARMEADTPSNESAKADGFAYQAKFLLQQSKYKEAIEAASRAIECGNRPALSHAYTRRAEAHYQLGDLNAATDDASNAISADTTNYGAYAVRAKCFEKLGRDDDAQADKRAENLWRNGRDL